MPTSLYAALTGLSNNAIAINVIGNNLANINTTGYKASKTSFAEVVGALATTTASNPIQVGLGSFISGASPVFSQGSILYSGNPTDAAINGHGFFVVDAGRGFGYTRAGNFGFTNTGFLVSSDGFKVLGYPAAGGVINTGVPPVPISILKGSILLPARATTNLGIEANLDSQTATNSTFSTAVQAYDSLGKPHTVSVTFTKTGNLTWNWTATIPAVDTGGAATDPPVSIGTGSFTFNSSGVLTSPASNPTLTINGLANGAANMTISFDVRDGNGRPRFTGFASPSSVSTTTQNGFAASALKDISFDSEGVITGIFDNGQVRPLAQLALANFPNVDGLVKFKGSTFVSGGNSGEPSVGIAGSGGRGTISGSSLEQSTVDIAQEFTSLIIAQRGYQANSRIITTTDELYQEAINLKR